MMVECDKFIEQNHHHQNQARKDGKKASREQTVDQLASLISPEAPSLTPFDRYHSALPTRPRQKFKSLQGFLAAAHSEGRSTARSSATFVRSCLCSPLLLCFVPPLPPLHHNDQHKVPMMCWCMASTIFSSSLASRIGNLRSVRVK